MATCPNCGPMGEHRDNCSWHKDRTMNLKGKWVKAVGDTRGTPFTTTGLYFVDDEWDANSAHHKVRIQSFEGTYFGCNFRLAPEEVAKRASDKPIWYVETKQTVLRTYSVEANSAREAARFVMGGISGKRFSVKEKSQKLKYVWHESDKDPR